MRYDFECRRCGSVFEWICGPEDKVRCVECGSRSTKRVISGGGGVLFKGRGFYGTDNRSVAYLKQAQEESGGA